MMFDRISMDSILVSIVISFIQAFLFTATTNLMATSYEKDGPGSDKSSSQTTLVSALRISLRVGICMCCFLLLFGDSMLRGLVGDRSSTAHEVLLASRKYVWIRALGMPAAAMIGTAQAACLGMQDTKSPLLATLLAALVNLMADILLVRQNQAWIGGVAGAAWATILSQYVAAGCYLKWLIGGEIPGEKLWKWIQNQLAKSKPTKQHSFPNLENDAIVQKVGTVRGVLRDRMKTRDLFLKRKSEPSSAKDFAPFVLPVTITQVGRCSVYVAMGMVVSGMNVVNMAANQILTAFFYALIPVADSLSQTAQALLPPLFEESSDGSVDSLRNALKSFGKAAMLCGAGLVGIVASIPVLTKMIMTTDLAVQNTVNSVVPIHMMIFLFHGVFCAAEGILLAQKDLGFLGRMYGFYFAVVPVLILQLQRIGPELQLRSVWHCFMAYQFFRILAWVSRVYYLYRKRQVSISNNST